jgi:cell division protein FtsN
MKILCFVLLSVFYSITLNAQTGEVQVIKDNRIDALVDKQSKVTPPDIKPQIDGFRVQVFFDSDKSKINAARSQVIAKFPKTDTYITYNAPNFILKVGDFRTRLEAERVKAKLEAEFPTSFIVTEKIYLPRLQKEDEE